MNKLEFCNPKKKGNLNHYLDKFRLSSLSFSDSIILLIW